MDMEVMEVFIMEPLVKEDSMPVLFLWLDIAEGIFDLDTGLEPEDTLPDLRRMEAGVVMEADMSESSRTKVPPPPPPPRLMFCVQSCSTMLDLKLENLKEQRFQVLNVVFVICLRNFKFIRSLNQISNVPAFNIRFVKWLGIFLCITAFSHQSRAWRSVKEAL